MTVETTFGSNYHLEVGRDLGAAANVYYYPGATRESGKDGVLVEVFNAQGDNWTGVFAFGTFSPKGMTGVYQMPDRDRFCVVAKGAAYVVDSTNPTDWEEVSLVPILDVRCSKSYKILLFANDTELCAYDRHGLKWTTERLSWHDLRIKEVSESEVIAEYWDIRDEAFSEVRVKLEDGTSIGAAKM
jgi:hypothetical protein